ncbi:MAG: ComEC/Rec2 family competence protein [Nostocoides sp.]
MKGLTRMPVAWAERLDRPLTRWRSQPFGGNPVVADPSRRRPLDLRLLGAVLVGWAVGAATLGLAWGVRGGLGAACLAAATAVAAIPRGFHRRLPLAPPGGAVGSLGLMLCAVGLTLSASAAHGAVRDASPLDELATDRAVVRIQGLVTADPIRVTSTFPGAAVVLVRVRVSHVVARGLASGAAATVLVRGDERWAGLHWHNSVTATGQLELAELADPEVATLRPLGPPIDVRPPGWAGRIADHVRAGLTRAAARLPADARGLLPGLVIGDTSRTPPDLTDAMRATGLTHLTAVSGSNVSAVLVLVVALLRLTGIPVRWRPVIGVAAIAGFVVLARPDPSVLRAAVMGGVGLVGVLLARHRSGLPVLAAAVLGLLCVDPWLSRSYGFVLSTLATLGLLVFVRPWGDAIDRRLPVRWAGLGQVVAIPAAAQLMCAPVVVLLQGSVSLIGLAANLLAAPFVAPATFGGVATAVVALVSNRLASLLVWVGGAPALAIAVVARFCSRVPGGTLPWPDGPPGAVLLAALSTGILLTGRWWVRQIGLHPRVALALVLVSVAGSVPTRLVTWPPANWIFAACDVGQGDGLVLRSGPTAAVVVDAGPDPLLMDRCLSGLGVRRIDAVILTHFHADHVDGLPGVLEGRPVERILVSPVRDPPYQAAEVERWARQRGIPVAPVWAGDELAIGSVHAHVWWPARRIDSGSVPNNASVVLTVDDDGLRLLLLGDVEREAGHQVLLALRHTAPEGATGLSPTPDGVPITVDVLKVAHHGSANADPALYDGVHAPVAIISVGAGNDYGHPAPSTVDRLRHDGYAVWRTDQRGAVAVRRDPRSGGPLVVSTR